MTTFTEHFWRFFFGFSLLATLKAANYTLNDTCDWVTCPSGQVCAQLFMPLFSAPVEAPRCVPHFPSDLTCTDTKCSNTSRCASFSGNSPYCYPNYDLMPCTKRICPRDKICFQENENSTTSKCVKPEAVPKCAGKNEIFTSCENGCDPTCDYPRFKNCNTSICRRGCKCRPGYLRLNGTCTKGNECPAPNTTTCASLKCPTGQKCKQSFDQDFLTPFGPPACVNTTANQTLCVDMTCPKNRMCTDGERKSYCFIKPDHLPCYKRKCPSGTICFEASPKNSTSKCILRKDAPKCTSPNETYTPCKNGRDEDVCDPSSVKKVSKNDCVPGCKCKVGFVRIAGKCVSYKECPPVVHGKFTCRPNEAYQKTENYLLNNCKHKFYNLNEREKHCVCRWGLRRNSKGNCVPLSECPKDSCDLNEEWSKCPYCEDYCGGTAFRLMCEKGFEHLQNNCEPGCGCKPNFARNLSDVCVPTASCTL
ncbi:unnamed protein product [Caenorhabditis auriculariae]|uniref:TIL domain-containing protein n=1 Tax=Caenorhabditis auriculariae TaxID=2777116 RepID=A0A8S1H9Y1_9PELO|nr:unnamed protein product [Caenorhabditis auriculariae]